MFKKLGTRLGQIFRKDAPPPKKTGRGYTKSAGKGKRGKPYGKPYSRRDSWLRKKKTAKRDR